MRFLALFILLGFALAQPASVRLEGVRHEYQRYNNCGPVTLGMAMSYWGSRDTQYQIAPVLKPNKKDKNVNTEEMAAYARSKGLEVHIGAAGNLGLLKTLIANRFPVIIETWFVVPEHGGMGHYRLLVGYDDKAGWFNAYDSYYGPKVTLKYREVDGLWQVFNRTYVVVYSKEREAELQAILGNRLDPQNLWQRAVDLARAETEAKPGNAFAWFNLGTSLLKQGDARGAAQAFDRSKGIGVYSPYDPGRPANAVSNWPWRMLWYQFGPYEAYYKVGRYSEVIALANDVLRRVGDHEESYYWRGKARAALGQFTAARADFRAALQYKPNYKAASIALQELSTQTSQR